MIQNMLSFHHFLQSTSIPKIEKKRKTFLGIAKQPHFENVLSNIYAFFFNVEEEHKFKDLFIRSLLACIEEQVKKKNKDFSSFVDFDIETEYATKGLGKHKKRGRIDLLLSNDHQAIIIENKVYHYLANDLDDYWLSVKLPSDTSKIGIILSLKPISKDNWKQFEYKDEFINLTHFEFMKKVNELKEEYIEESNPHFHFVLEDLIQNINNISTPNMNSENIQFFLDNKEKINQLVQFKYEFKKHIISEIEKAGNSITGVKLITLRKSSYNEKRLRYFQSTKHSDLLYTIVFEDLLKGEKNLQIFIEVRGKALKTLLALNTIQFSEDENNIIQKSFVTKTNATWAHFAYKRMSLEETDIADLGGFIQNKIKEDHFESVFMKLESYLKERKNDH